MLNVSHENDLIFMPMNVQVTYTNSLAQKKTRFATEAKSKLGIGLFIRELLKEPVINIPTLTTFQGCRF